jgi:hypothetical protein
VNFLSFCVTVCNSVINNCRMAYIFFQMMAAEQILVPLLMIVIWTHAVTGIEPVSVGLGIGIATGSFLYSTWNKLVCPFTECCDGSWIPQNFTSKSSSHSGCNM